MNHFVLVVVSSLGWAGAVSTVAAYALVSRGRLAASSALFQSVNAVGAALLGLSALAHGNLSSAVSNGVWMFFGLQALAMAALAGRRPVAAPPSEDHRVEHRSATMRRRRDRRDGLIASSCTMRRPVCGPRHRSGSQPGSTEMVGLSRR